MASTEFDRILNFDPLLEAEKITGKSYTEDKATEGLGFLMHIEHTERKRDELMLREDTYSGMPFMEAVDLVVGLGFEPIYAQIIPDNSKYGRGNPVHFYIYWRKGIMLTLESYGVEGEGRGLTVNSSHIRFTWMTGDNGTGSCPVHGSSHWTRMTPGFDGNLAEDPWVQHVFLDVREGLKHELEKLASEGIVPEVWPYTDALLHIESYAERRSRDENVSWNEEFKDIDAFNLERISHFPDDIRDMMIAGRRGKDWDDR